MSFDSLFNVLLIILGFGILIGVHELGHFIAAKWAGIRTNAFAIGMGPQILSYRKGVGFSYKSSSSKVIAKCGKDANDMTDAQLESHGISETEYSLRLLPIGGFVSMLGQEDGKPDAVSDGPRSYNNCPIGKRMIVVSAGVIMNLLLAGVFFLICFQIGVNFEAPIIGHIIPDSPAARATAIGDSTNLLRTGDIVVSIDGKPTTTFTDIQIAGAMAKPGVPVVLEVQRKGETELLTYSITPKSVTQRSLLEFGLYPASSLTLRDGDLSKETLAILKEQYGELQALKPKMKMTTVTLDSHDQILTTVSQWEDFQSVLNQSDYITSIETVWTDGVESAVVKLPVFPELGVLRLVEISQDAPQNFEFGLMGLVPLSQVNYILETSPNLNVLQKGDVITRVASLEMPRMGQLRNYLTTIPDGEIELSLLRDGDEIDVVALLQGGKLGVLLASALDTPIFAQPLEEVLVEVDGQLVRRRTAIAGQQLLAGSSFSTVFNEHAEYTVKNWSELRLAVESALVKNQSHEQATIAIRNPTANAEFRTIELTPSSSEIDSLASTNWTTPFAQQMFEPLYVVRSSGGNPIKALQMGFDETINMVVMTYLTIDRLIRRSVGVDQLRGPVGIIHIGSKIADRGMSYLLFFLAIISVNLAVLNFLPLPIVDGGLFLYLIYEKIFSKPPSIAFQNAAAVFGLGLIGMLFIVTFYNDIARLVG